jgi:hypothetical protein
MKGAGRYPAGEVQLTTEELTALAAANTVAIAENTKSIAQLTQNSLILHDSIKGLEAIAESHNDDIEKLTGEVRALTRQWQAYINRLPSH